MILPGIKTRGDSAIHDVFEKFTCFVSPDELQDVKRWAKKQKARLYRAKTKPCEPLRADIDIGYVPPNVWNRDCRRQGYWYRESPAADKCLIVSSAPLEQGSPGTRV